MARNETLSNLAANTKINALTALLEGGYMDFYDGVQPASADDPVTTQVRLASMKFTMPAFEPGVDGVATANTIESDLDASGQGDVTWYRCWKFDHITPVCDGSVGLTGCNLNVNQTFIQLHARVDVPSFALTSKKQNTGS